jgi:hypothetical protein
VPAGARTEQLLGEDYFGAGPVSLQFTFVLSPPLHFCLCDCCSFADFEVSFSPELGVAVDMLESSEDALEEGGVEVSGGGEVLVSAGGEVEEFAGAFCACAAAQSTKARLPRMLTMLERVITTPWRVITCHPRLHARRVPR